MTRYSVVVTAHCPAPRMREYKVDASGFGTAINRAVAQYRKDIGRKVIEFMTVTVTKLGPVL